MLFRNTVGLCLEFKIITADDNKSNKFSQSSEGAHKNWNSAHLKRLQYQAFHKYHHHGDKTTSVHIFICWLVARYYFFVGEMFHN